ncbi:MAG: alcohol dehydrogenase catalytic domain-containing protein [Candidatus Caldatribacterium sp.]|nr:alcohol dehydrogenase catalytic domain-containing protein [Candidatus Caldatribacterium sp.]
MKAMVLEKYGAPLVLREIEVPRIGDGEVLVKVKGAGICGTDIKIQEGRVPTKSLPLVPGHEISGEVVALGRDVRDFQIGDEIVVSFYISCGTCRFCKSGRNTICQNLEGRIGFERDGGFAEYVAVPEGCLVRKPPSLSFVEAAVVSDAIATCYHALVRRAQVTEGDWVVMIGGGGGLGLHAIQIAKLLGAKVIGIDLMEEKLRLMRELGADFVLDGNRDSWTNEVYQCTDGAEVDHVIDFVCSEQSISKGMEILGRGGRLVLVAYGPKIKVDTLKAHLFEIDVLGTRAATKEEISECLSLVAQGRLRPIIGKVLELEEINYAFQLLRDNKVNGRIGVIVS